MCFFFASIEDLAILLLPRRPPLLVMHVSLVGNHPSPCTARLCQLSQGTVGLLLCPDTGPYHRQQCHNPGS